MASISNTTTITTSSSTTNTATTMSHHHHHYQQQQLTYSSDPTAPNTTFVQADPSNFRTIVQKLTGASEESSTQKLPLTPKRPAFKLHERRQSARKLEIKLHNICNNRNKEVYNNSENNNGNNECSADPFFLVRRRGFLVSPVSHLDFWARVSPRSPSEEEEEERAIAEKGFYLRPSPLNTPREGPQPELLPLFPLHSPRDNDNHHQC